MIGSNLFFWTFFGVCFLIALLVYWFRHGRDPKGERPVIPHYVPIEGVSVLEAGVLLDDVLNVQDILYELWGLHLRGLIEISPGPGVKKGGKLNLEDYEVKRMKIEDKSLTDAEIRFLDRFFNYEEGEKVNLKAVYANIFGSLFGFKREIYNQMTSSGVYPEPPFKLRRRFYIFGDALVVWAVIIFVAWVDMFYSGDVTKSEFAVSIFISLVLFAMGVVNNIATRRMARKTLEGVETKNRLLGFKMYIETAEKDRIKRLREEDFSLYKRILPFAMLFKCADRWLEPIYHSKSLPPECMLFNEIGFVNITEFAFEESRGFFVWLVNLVFGKGEKL